MFLGSANPSFLRFGKKKPQARYPPRMCKSQYSASFSQVTQRQEAKKRSFSCFTFDKNYHHSFILPRFSVLVELALSSKLVYIGTANFNDIHNLLGRFIFFFPFFAYLPTLSQCFICPRNMKLI